MYVACCCSWGPGVCCHMLPSFHSHERSLLAKPRISNLRVHVKSDDMCVQLVSALSYIIIILIGSSMSNSSMEYPWYPESIQKTLIDMKTSWWILWLSKTFKKQNLGAVANYQLVVRTASRSDTTATFLLTSCSMCQFDTICWLPE